MTAFACRFTQLPLQVHDDFVSLLLCVLLLFIVLRSALERCYSLEKSFSSRVRPLQSTSISSILICIVLHTMVLNGLYMTLPTMSDFCRRALDSQQINDDVHYQILKHRRKGQLNLGSSCKAYRDGKYKQVVIFIHSNRKTALITTFLVLTFHHNIE